jgi:dTMP kinase
MNNCRYICLEGCEGSGKTTHAKKLVDYLTHKGFKVLHTKEPGTPHAPLTMELRGIMLDAKYDAQLTTPAREMVSQAIRSIHLEKVVLPALSEYNFIIQDRGILSGLSYGHACGNSHWFMTQLLNEVVKSSGRDIYSLYDKVILLKNDAAKGLLRAQAAKQEFAAGDAIEARGAAFMQQVSSNMDDMVKAFPHSIINMEGKPVAQNFDEILKCLGLGE